MLSFVKNSACGVLAICFAIACKPDTTIEATPFKATNTTTLSGTPTFTLLQYGELPPPLYFNSVEIIGKRYNIKFVDVAGCVVSERLVDSVKQYNGKTYTALEQLYKHDVSLEIDGRISAEYAYLRGLDSVLRKDPEIKKQKELDGQLIYYTKKNKDYLAHFIVTEPDHKVLNFKLKLVITVDSISKRISGVTQKDSLIKQFSDLQL